MNPRSLWRELAPLCFMVFAEFLAMGLPLPVLPLQVHGHLGFGAFVVGLVIGAQSWATLLTRHFAGTRTDARGPKSAAVLGLSLSMLAGSVSALSSVLAQPAASLGVLLLGRGLLGLGESLVVTSALGWGVALAGRERSGVVMAWVGIAMYGALAAGSPLGVSVHGAHGFTGVTLLAAAAPALGLFALPLVRTVAPVGGTRLPFHRVAGLIWRPGAGLALSALGFGAIAAFSTLRFQERGWPHASLAMSAFGAAYVLARLFLAKLPDRFGGARIAAGSAAVVVLGQTLSWLATSGEQAVLGAALTGLGFSLAFPSFGVEAIAQVPPQSRGAALGAYAACFDLAMGVGVPALGLLAAGPGADAVFGAGAGGALLALVIATSLVRRQLGLAAQRTG